MSSAGELAWVTRARRNAARCALVDAAGELRYAELAAHSARVAGALLALGDDRDDLEEARVAMLVPPSSTWVACQWGIWRAGGVAVPLCLSHPPPELELVIADCGAQMLIAAPAQASLLAPLARERGLHLLITEEALVAEPAAAEPTLEERRRAMIVYTSGSTGRPKGVVTTHRQLRAQIEALTTAWAWRPDDRILGVLPLHHVHGIVNVVGCALWSAAVCELDERFDAERVWERFAADGLTLFMAVPTIYVRLIAAWDEAPAATQRRWSAGAARLRLMVSGSAPLPMTVLERWQEIASQRLLERYGMTETGMILSNPLAGERRPGHVGQPLPGVELRLRGEDGGLVSAPGAPGEVEVRGAAVFHEYWNRPEETRAAFSADGWFRTGDVAVLEGDSYRLLGRQSVDIVKTGGYKVSALEIEETLREHPAIVECAVVGLPDAEWGERVAAAIVCRGEPPLTLDELRRWAKERLAPYKVPTRLQVATALPRNILGKIAKRDVVALFD